jgi:hypothetical protein
MNHFFIKILTVFVLTYPIYSYADWQWTKWGMEPDAVISASKGIAHMATDEENKQHSITNGRGGATLSYALVIGSHSSNNYKFYVSFQFAPFTKELICVELSSDGVSDYKSLRDDLITVYGPVSNESPTGYFFNTTWLTDKDNILLSTYDGKFIHLRYCDKEAIKPNGL